MPNTDPGNALLDHASSAIVNRFLPFWRLLFNMSLPLLLPILLRKPNLLTRLILLG
jgi:hypothetical protein